MVNTLSGGFFILTGLYSGGLITERGGGFGWVCCGGYSGDGEGGAVVVVAAAVMTVMTARD